MTKAVSGTALAAPGLHPNQVIRKSEGRKYFGLGPSQLAEAIKRGEIPAPFSLTESGRAQGWLGQQILDHQRRRMK
jgi:predicted DNA-binding transcriptional regulator AlpA